MFVQIDRSSCQGSGYCVEIAPDVFELVDGLARVRPDVEDLDALADQIEEAATLCPATAIRL